MTAAGGKRMLLTAALLVAGIRLWMQIRGQAKTPFPEWAIGWSATFFFLAVLSEFAPQAAGGLSLAIVVGDFLANGVGLFTSINTAILGAEKGGTVLTPQPFAPTSSPGTSSPSSPSSPSNPHHHQ